MYKCSLRIGAFIQFDTNVFKHLLLYNVVYYFFVLERIEKFIKWVSYEL